MIKDYYGLLFTRCVMTLVLNADFTYLFIGSQVQFCLIRLRDVD